MSESPPYVWFQVAEHSGETITIVDAPAVVTSRRKVPAYVRNPDGSLAYKTYKRDGKDVYVEPREQIVSGEVEAVSLTVFRVGSFEFLKDIVPWSDELGQSPGSHSYREWGTDRPEIKLKKPEDIEREEAEDEDKAESEHEAAIKSDKNLTEEEKAAKIAELRKAEVKQPKARTLGGGTFDPNKPGEA